LILSQICKSINKCQEEIAEKEGIPLLVSLSQQKNKDIQRVILPLLCQFVQNSEICRKKLIESGGFKVLLEGLDDEYYQAKILETIAFWLEYDQLAVEKELIEPEVLKKFIEIFGKASKVSFQNILPRYLRIIQNSDRSVMKISESSDFLKEIAERFDVNKMGMENRRKECLNPSAFVRRDLLEILGNLCLKHGNPKKLLSVYNFEFILKYIVENERAVFLKNKAAQLLQVYSEEAGFN